MSPGSDDFKFKITQALAPLNFMSSQSLHQRTRAAMGSLVAAGDAEVTGVGNRYLSCSGLAELDLTPLAHLTGVGDGFLEGCCGLTSLDLTPLAHLTGVGNMFLWDCSGLTALDLTPLAHLTCVGNAFLAFCSSLTALDLTPLAHLTSVGNKFLYECSGLTAVDLTLCPLQQPPMQSISGASHPNSIARGDAGWLPPSLAPMVVAPFVNTLRRATTWRSLLAALVEAFTIGGTRR